MKKHEVSSRCEKNRRKCELDLCVCVCVCSYVCLVCVCGMCVCVCVCVCGKGNLLVILAFPVFSPKLFSTDTQTCNCSFCPDASQAGLIDREYFQGENKRGLNSVHAGQGQRIFMAGLTHKRLQVVDTEEGNKDQGTWSRENFGKVTFQPKIGPRFCHLTPNLLSLTGF